MKQFTIVLLKNLKMGRIRNANLNGGVIGKPNRYAGKQTRHPYVMNEFQGTPEIQRTFAEINNPQNKTVTYCDFRKEER